MNDNEIIKKAKPYCEQKCRHGGIYFCSENPSGGKGNCEYWKQCGTIAFYCKH